MIKRKLLRNAILICLILFCYFYLNGYYLTREKCVIDSLRGLYCDTFEEIMYLENGKHGVTIMTNLDKMTYSLMGTRKIGPFYRIGSGSHGNQIKQNNDNLAIMRSYADGRGTLIGAYRFNKDINYVTVLFGDGEIITLNEWVKDFSACLLDEYKEREASYFAYDINGVLIDKMEY